VSGVVGALGFNGIGVAGIAPNVSLMPLRFFGPAGGETAAAIEAIGYAVDQGALVINASWGGGPNADDHLLRQAIRDAGAAGVLVVAAAGNDAMDTDVNPEIPAAFDLDNIISVAASTPWRNLADFSNWGATSVDLAAPGEEIISTTPSTGDRGFPETSYQISYPSGYPGPAGWSGTSMATPGDPGSQDYFTVTGLDPSAAYSFGLEVVDNAGNRSGHTEVEATTRPASVLLSDAVRFEDSFDGNDCSNWHDARIAARDVRSGGAATKVWHARPRRPDGGLARNSHHVSGAERVSTAAQTDRSAFSVSEFLCSCARGRECSAPRPECRGGGNGWDFSRRSIVPRTCVVYPGARSRTSRRSCARS
jgi:hypothetical protein